jgi:methylthioribose-1-phosphate isomerase
MSLVPLRWSGDHLALLDQRQLPSREVWIELRTWLEVAAAIRDMAVRGAPAIGITAAYGMALAALAGDNLEIAAEGLCDSRPTAVNLSWAIERVLNLPSRDFASVLTEAQRIESEDVACNAAIGKLGARLIPENARVLTICNTGSLATGGHGTALGIIRTAYREGKVQYVYACETRPRQQGLRLTAWDLMHDKIPFAAIADGAAGSLMHQGLIDAVVAGADRIAANGDTANKLGTYSLAVLAHHHGLPFIIAAPTSTLDLTLADGSSIPIEERSGDELREIEGIQVAPEGCPVFNPAFDITPNELIGAIVTETGIFRHPFRFEGT